MDGEPLVPALACGPLVVARAPDDTSQLGDMGALDAARRMQSLLDAVDRVRE